MTLGLTSAFPRRLVSLGVCALVAFATRSSAVGAEEPLHVAIDRVVKSWLKPESLSPAEDVEFLRRVTLDLTGVVPAAEDVRRVVQSPGRVDRAVLVERLLASHEHARHMQQVFDGWLMQRRRERHVSVEQWQVYLYDAFARNRRWDQLTYELLSSDGADSQTRAAARFFLDRECRTEELVRDISSVFLGRNLHCAQCHDHPIVTDYRQADFFGIAAFLDRSFLFQDKTRGQMVVAEKGEGETAFTSALTQVRGSTLPRVFDGPEFLELFPASGAAYAIPPGDGVRPLPLYSRRAQLPRAIVSHPSFSRNVVNRLWSQMFGRGIVEPVDQDHADNPPLHPQLLDLLSRSFAESGYDLRGLLRELALTELYGRSSDSAARCESDGTVRLAVQPVRKLSPEQLTSSWLRGTGHREAQRQALRIELQSTDPKLLAILAASQAAEEIVLDRRLAPELEKMIQIFVTSLPGEAPRSDTTPQQGLYLLNGTVLREWLAPRPGNLLDGLWRASSDADVAEELFLSVLSRRPSDEERAWVEETLRDAGLERTVRLSDLAEALLTSVEFRFNH